jgi:hypothetical protein
LFLFNDEQRLVALQRTIAYSYGRSPLVPAQR